MRPFRSGILGALLAIACIPGIDALPRMEERLRETLMSAILKWTPDLAPEATLELLLSDVRATALLGPSHEQAADALAGTLREWANTGRSPLIVQDRATGAAGTWHTRVRFLAPGSYSAEVYRIERHATVEGSGEREVDAWMSAPLATRAAATEAAFGKARELQRAAFVAATMVSAGQVTEEQARRDPDAFARYVMSDHHPAMTSRPHGPVDFKRAGEESRARRAIRRTFHSPTASDIAAAKRIEAALHPAGRCTCEGAGAGDCDWCVMNRRREAREHRADLRDAQAAGRKTRARKKARRGW